MQTMIARGVYPRLAACDRSCHSGTRTLYQLTKAPSKYKYYELHRRPSGPYHQRRGIKTKEESSSVGGGGGSSNSTTIGNEAYWWRKITTIQQVVPNTGSIARDILAAERTFLAWSRTGLGFVGAGSALFAAYHREDESFFSSDDNKYHGKDAKSNETNGDSSHKVPNLHLYPTLAASLLVANGAFLLAFATRRYLRTVTLMTLKQEPALFPIDTKGTLTAVAATACSTITSLALVLSTSIQPSLWESKRGVDKRR